MEEGQIRSKVELTDKIRSESREVVEEIIDCFRRVAQRPRLLAKNVTDLLVIKFKQIRQDLMWRLHFNREGRQGLSREV